MAADDHPDRQPDPALGPIGATQHFVPRLGVQFGAVDRLSVELGDRTADVAFIGLLTDMAGGQIVIAERAPVDVVTTHLEVHGVAGLVGPGEITAESRILASSTRRCIVETHFRLGDSGHAVAHGTFAVRPGSLTSAVMSSPPPAPPSAVPLWEFIGAAQTDGGSAITLGPLIGNHIGALQGGACIALAEAAAVVQLEAGENLDSVSIHYLHAVYGTTATATARRRGRSILVDIHADGASKELTRLTFTVA